MFNVNVNGGTNAGWRRIKPPNTEFDCPNCVKTIKKHWAKCPDCAFRPPERG